MIIQKVFHTYKEEFPILSNNRLPQPFTPQTLHKLVSQLILELADVVTLPRYAYITRHTDDSIPRENLEPFLNRSRDFVVQLGENQLYNIPTVWFVGFFEDKQVIADVKARLNQKKVRHFESGSEHRSFEEINDAYRDNREDANLFPKFLHQVTLIGIDLLSNPASLQSLRRLGCLEWLQYRNEERRQSDLSKMEEVLTANSQYYREVINPREAEHAEFWRNFTKVKRTKVEPGKVFIGSWPHFLFNICGVSSSPRTCE